MNLAKRIRDLRYSKGWGPDELANRAKISRTGFYQIEHSNAASPRLAHSGGSPVLWVCPWKSSSTPRPSWVRQASASEGMSESGPVSHAMVNLGSIGHCPLTEGRI